MFDTSDIVEALENDPEGDWKAGQLFSVLIPDGDDGVMKKGFSLVFKVNPDTGERDRGETYEIAHSALREVDPSKIQAIVRKKTLPLHAQIESANRQIKILESLANDVTRDKRERLRMKLRSLSEVLED